jgi:response regulator RpfG family c-di-GMP phosphodiesterase
VAGNEGGETMTEINVLFVDDERLTLKALARVMDDEPYSVHFAESGKEALTIMAERPIDLLITDMRMPNMDGWTLLRLVKEHYPDTVRLALSACNLSSELLPCINTGQVFRYISKPFSAEEVIAAIEDAVEYFVMRRDRIALVVELQDKNEQLHVALERQKQTEKQLKTTIAELQQANMRVKQLTGLLPICAGCKKICQGDGTWTHIERYIEEHSQASFSHGICPECVRKLYPQFFSNIYGEDRR